MAHLELGPFRANGAANCVRLILGTSTLVVGAGVMFRLAGRVLPRPLLNQAMRVWAGATIRFLSLEIDAEGLDNIDEAQQYLVVALHEGFADPLVLSRLGLDLRFVVRDELFSWRLLGPALRSTGQIPVNPEARVRGYRALLRECRAAVRNGESVAIFPQGTLLGLETAFRPGAFHLADKLGIPVLPVVLTGTGRVWAHPFNNEIRFGQRVSMRVQPALPVGRAVESMRQLEASMKRVAQEPDMAPARRFVPERDGFWDNYSYEIDPNFPALHRQVADHRRSLASGGPPSLSTAS